MHDERPRVVVPDGERVVDVRHCDTTASPSREMLCARCASGQRAPNVESGLVFVWRERGERGFGMAMESSCVKRSVKEALTEDCDCNCSVGVRKAKGANDDLETGKGGRRSYVAVSPSP